MKASCVGLAAKLSRGGGHISVYSKLSVVWPKEALLKLIRMIHFNFVQMFHLILDQFNSHWKNVNNEARNISFFLRFC